MSLGYLWATVVLWKTEIITIMSRSSFVIEILLKRSIESLSSILSRKPNKVVMIQNQGKTYYESKYSCRPLGLFLSQPIYRLRPIIDEYPDAFMTGLFSADGCASAYLYRNELRIHLILANSDRSLLRIVEQVLLTRFNIHSRTYLARRRGATWKMRETTVILRKNAYQLRIETLEDVRIFGSSIGFTIARKQEVLRSAIQLIITRGRRKAAEAWQSLRSERAMSFEIRGRA